LAATGLRAPRLLAGDAAAPTPFAVREFIPGTTAASYMGALDGAQQVARAMGALLPRLAAVPALNATLNDAWAHPARLAALADKYLARTRPLLDGTTTDALAAAIAALPSHFAGRPAVFAHGDFCPVNVLLATAEVPAKAGDTQQDPSLNSQRLSERATNHQDTKAPRIKTGEASRNTEQSSSGSWWLGDLVATSQTASQAPRVVALLDLEFARVADPLFDAAWWGWVVRFHHPPRWVAAYPHLLAAAGIADDAANRARIGILQRLRCLEAIDFQLRTGRPDAAAMWADRLRTTLAWE
jgi:aminoglycoside phosphotransferase (APT) family kinase protein